MFFNELFNDMSVIAIETTKRYHTKRSPPSVY